MRRVVILLAAFASGAQPDGGVAPSAPTLPEPLSLPMLWNLAQTNNPDLQQAVAEVEAAQGKFQQAGKYPNPRIIYEQEALGAKDAPAGNLRVQINQEILTAGKRRLDLAIAARGADEAVLRLVQRRFEILTRVRRAYYDYMGLLASARVNEEVVEALQKSVDETRHLVERLRNRPAADLLRLETLLEEAKISRMRSRINLQAAWRQLAAEVGVPHLLPPAAVDDLNEPIPRWQTEAVLQRVLAVHPDMRLAMLQVEQARLAIDRARAEARPNVNVGGGYSWDFLDNGQGAIISVETALPVWDRKQGRIVEAQARFRQAAAAQQSTATRLIRETTTALAAYQGTRHQMEALQSQVLPRQQESLELVRDGYRAGRAQITFADVLLAEETLHETRLKVSEARRELWKIIADLQGLMQLDLGQDLKQPCP